MISRMFIVFIRVVSPSITSPTTIMLTAVFSALLPGYAPCICSVRGTVSRLFGLFIGLC